MELRKDGHVIATEWTTDITSEGFAHRVGRYILSSESGTAPTPAEEQVVRADEVSETEGGLANAAGRRAAPWA